MKELKAQVGNDVRAYIQSHYLGRLIDDSLSPAGNWLLATLLKFEEGKATLSMPIRAEMSNAYGMIHGGMLSVFIDECIGWAVLSMNANDHYTSINLSTDFLYMAAVGKTITAEARVVRMGKKICNVHVDVFNEEGKLIAVSHSNLAHTSQSLSLRTS